MSRLTLKHQLGLSVRQLPKNDIVLVITGRQDHAALWTDLGTSKLGPSSHLVIVFFV